MVQFANYGQARERIATESELEIFEILKQLANVANLELVRKSDNYVTAVLGEWDLARFKYTQRAKWILFPILERPKEKHKITDPDDVRQFGDLVSGSLAVIKKYL